MKIDYVLTGFDKFDTVIREIAKSKPGRLVKKEAAFTGDLVVIMSLHPGVIEAQERLRAEKRPYLFLDHAYWQRGHDRKNYRIVPGEIYNNRVVDGDESRMFRWGARLSPVIRSHGEYVLAVMPSANVARIYGPEAVKAWMRETAVSVAKQRNLPIRIKIKHDGDFNEALSKAACVVSFASAADVEAVCAGVDGYFSDYSPAAPVSLEKPKRCDRLKWAASLAWQQWNVDEMRSGDFWRVYGVD